MFVDSFPQLEMKISLVPVAKAYNSSHSEGRDQKDLSSKPTWVCETLSQKKKNHKKGLKWLKKEK
jgi:hypothetical protein